MRTRRSRPDRDGERGIALILTLLVLLVLLAVVSQLALSTRLDYQAAVARGALARMDLAIDSALLDAGKMLQDDLAGGDGGEAGALGGLGYVGGAGGGANPFAAAAGASGGGRGTLPGTGGAGSSAGPALPGGGAGGGGAVDCLNDAWAKPARQTAGDIEIVVQIEDENRKLNLLSILAEDEEFARQARDRVVRLLDTFREETPHDLDLATAETLVRNLEDWMRARNRTEELPRPALLSNEENSTLTLPLTVDELRLVPGFDAALLYDFRVGEVIVPGLSSVVTVWTVLEEAPQGAGEAGLGTTRPSLAGGGTGERAGLAGVLRASGSSVRSEPGGASPQAGAGGGFATEVGQAINVNTAPRSVLASLLPSSGMPAEAIEALLRYRNEELETEGEEPTPEETLGLEEEEPPRKYFSSLDELDQVPEFGNLYPDLKQEFKALLGTTSEVFSIRVTARIRPEGTVDSFFGELPEPGEEEEGPGLLRRVRSVVLRRQGEAGVEIVPIVRWEVRKDRRFRIPDFPPEEMPVGRSSRGR